jgi:hypothetical protein
VISGGIGIFFDNPPAGMLDQELGNPGNPPATTLFTIEPLDAAGIGTIGIAPFTAGPAAFQAASSAFTLSKSYNQLSAILDPIIGYNPPVSFNSIQGTVHSPQAQEWNLKIDQEITKSVALSLNYVGNHSINVPYFNSWWNALATNAVFANVPGIKTASTVLPNYGEVITLQSDAVSNYNGVTASVRVQYHNWFMSHFNYTFSHTLDETSNGGLFPIGGWPGGFNIQTQVNPGNLRANNYGNADYDVRNLFGADYVITPPAHFENRFLKAALGGWQWSGKVYARSGLPYTVLDANASATWRITARLPLWPRRSLRALRIRAASERWLQTRRSILSECFGVCQYGSRGFRVLELPQSGAQPVSRPELLRPGYGAVQDLRAERTAELRIGHSGVQRV